MPGVTCPTCSSAIPADDVNIAGDVAFCRACGTLSRPSEIVAAPDSARALGKPPPRGCRVRDDGVTMVAEASARSLSGAVVATIFALFWNTVVAVFVLIAARSLWAGLVGPVPSWFPSPFGVSGSGPQMPLGVAVFLSVFLVPFIGVGVFVAWNALVFVGGGVTVRIRGADGQVRTGVGPFGRTRRFDALGVRAVRLVESKSEESTTRHIAIETERELRFGSMLSEKRREWLAGVLRAVLEPRATLRHPPRVRPIPPTAGPPLPIDEDRS